MAIADETLFSEFKQAAENLPPPQINSMWVWIWQDKDRRSKGFRFMGQHLLGRLCFRSAHLAECWQLRKTTRFT